jgi:putative acetyltransferase
MIRRAHPDDAIELAELHAASIRGLCAGHYTDEQIVAWTAVLVPDVYRMLIERAHVLVCDEGGTLAGLGVCDPGQGLVNAVYVRPGAAGRGVGRALMVALEAALLGAGPVHLNATRNAVGFYQRLGYSIEGEVENRLPGGVALPAVAMVKASSR